MPSSPTAPAADHRVSSLREAHLLDLLTQVADPRDAHGMRYALAGMLALALTAVMAGALSFTAIGEWAADLPADALERLGLGLGLDAAPRESTMRKAFARLDAGELDRQVAAFAATRSARIAGRRVIAIDGKTIRGARTGTGHLPHLVAALDQTSGVVIGQSEVDAKTNEIPALREMLPALGNLTGAVTTADAMHTQRESAQAITAAGADYVLTVKANQAKLHTSLKALPWQGVPAHRHTETGHGRRTTPTIKAIEAGRWSLEFPAATQIAQIRRTTTRAGKKSIEVIYIITSADHRAAPSHVLATWVRSHWSIENRLHWVRDVTFDEDRSQVRTASSNGHAAQHHHHHLAPGRHQQHRRRATPQRQTPRTDPHPAPDLLKHDLSGALASVVPEFRRSQRGCSRTREGNEGSVKDEPPAPDAT